MSYNSKYKGKELEEVLDSVETKENILKAVYPVGSIYMSMTDTNPNVLFGFGTWEQVKDRFLLSAGDTYKAGNTGGEATHSLTVDEMPSHKHTAKTSENGSHTHTIGNDEDVVYNTLVNVVMSIRLLLVQNFTMVQQALAAVILTP